MQSNECATNIVIALINNSRVNSAEQAAQAYKTILKAITYPND